MANDVIFVPNSGERGRIGATTGVDVHGNKNILTGYYVASGVDATYFGRLGDRNDDIRHYGGDSSSDDGGGGGGGGGGPTTSTYTVAANGDDGVGSTGYVSYSNNTLSPSYLNTNRTYIQIGAQYEGEETEWDHSIGFFRFDNITAAQGATISSAYLKPYKMSFVGSAVNPDINFKIRALDQDDPAAPSSASDLRGNVPGLYTTAEALWDHDTLRAESNSSEVTSPDLKDVIQEIVNRSGWSSGNSIVIVMYLNNAASWPTYTGGTTNYVSFESYDNTNSNPAKLEITI